LGLQKKREGGNSKKESGGRARKGEEVEIQDTKREEVIRFATYRRSRRIGMKLDWVVATQRLVFGEEGYGPTEGVGSIAAGSIIGGTGNHVFGNGHRADRG